MRDAVKTPQIRKSLITEFKKKSHNVTRNKLQPSRVNRLYVILFIYNKPGGQKKGLRKINWDLGDLLG